MRLPDVLDEEDVEACETLPFLGQGRLDLPRVEVAGPAGQDLAGGIPARRRRSASRSVAMSPSRPPRRKRSFSARAVASRSVVLPEPGDEIRFTTSVPEAAKRLREAQPPPRRWPRGPSA